MITHETPQLTFHSQIYDRCVPQDHAYRQMQDCLDMKRLSKVIEKCYSKIGTIGYAVECAIKMLLLQNILRAKGCASGIIQRNNRKTKNSDLDRWRSSVRMPFENVFARLSKFTRYRGKLKALFQGFA